MRVVGVLVGVLYGPYAYARCCALRAAKPSTGGFVVLNTGRPQCYLNVILLTPSDNPPKGRQLPRKMRMRMQKPYEEALGSIRILRMGMCMLLTLKCTATRHYGRAIELARGIAKEERLGCSAAAGPARRCGVLARVRRAPVAVYRQSPRGLVFRKLVALLPSCRKSRHPIPNQIPPQRGELLLKPQVDGRRRLELGLCLLLPPLFDEGGYWLVGMKVASRLLTSKPALIFARFGSRVGVKPLLGVRSPRGPHAG